jgi:hypothetical protein
MSLKIYATTAISNANSGSQNSFDTIQIKIDKFILGVSISVNVYFSNQSTIIHTNNYTFLFSKTIPSYYNAQNQTSLYPYYLPQLQNISTYPTLSYPTIDLYILNALVLPSLKNETIFDNNPFTSITDLTNVSSPQISNVKYTNNLQYNYFTISFRQPSLQNITNYEISVNSDKTKLQTPCDTNNITLKTTPISTGQSYNISVYTKNMYTGSTGTYQITPVTIAPYVQSISGPTGNQIYVNYIGLSGASRYEFNLYKNKDIVYGPTGTNNLDLSIPVSSNGFYNFNINATDSHGNTGPYATSYINFTNYN